jgi:hypothetical protein
MIVTNITARWTRRLPREQYGHAEAELIAQAVLSEGDVSLEEAIDTLLGTLRDGVSAKLGIGIDKSKADVSSEEVESPPTTTAPTRKSSTVRSERVKTKLEPAPTVVDNAGSSEDATSEKDATEDLTDSDSVGPSDLSSVDHEKVDLHIKLMTPSELQTWLLGLHRDKLISVETIKEELSKLGVARTNDLDPTGVVSMKAAVERLLL